MGVNGVFFRRTAMKIRSDSVFVSSVFFTIALLCLIRAALWNLQGWHDKVLMAKLDAGFRAQVQTASYLGFACLAIILIGLIVIWSGYISRSRSAWLVMCVITWIWAFPLFVSPLFEGKIVVTFSEWLRDALSEPGLPRTLTESTLIFLLMVIALILPTKAFFFRGNPPKLSVDRR